MVCVSDLPNARVYRVHDPRHGSVDSFTVVQVQSGICLLGDYAPGHNGAVSSRGYAIEWFAATRDYRYLAEKFLPKGWHADNVRWWLDDLIQEMVEDDEADASQLAELRQLAHGSDSELFEDARRFQDRISDILPGHVWTDSSPHGYDPNDLVALAVCQQVFARLWSQAKSC